MAAALPPSGPTEDPPLLQRQGLCWWGGSCVPKACGHLGLPRNRSLGRVNIFFHSYLADLEEATNYPGLGFSHSENATGIIVICMPSRLGWIWAD